ncbi:MAG: adenylate/guanylate cyclase domain-containing protein [Bacteroidales bacterium]|nr:adenylate/guanylate cyclase domain-containing protein [Bacteroidales bacterium]
MTGKFTRLITDLRLILKITLSWMILGAIFTLYDYVTTAAGNFYIRTENYNFLAQLAANVGGAFLGGIFGASLIVLYSNRKLRKKSFITYVLLNSLFVLSVIFLINVIISQVIWSIRLEVGILNKETFFNSMRFIYSLQMLRNMAIWFVVTLGTTFILRVSEKYGPGVLEDILLGKYHSPVEEERIFMFLDIKSSTTLAENLGHNKYFNLLKDFFADITDAIIYSKGDIYQYVGDEVVVSWKIHNGLKNNNCLNCFFEARKEIAKQSSKYLKKYSIVPEFKAGIHLGAATVGEIGVLKKEIAFSGDVLNTTSRIQNECNKYKTDLLISEDLLNKLEIDSTFVVRKIGEIELRGKQAKTRLYSIQENYNT